MAHSPSDALPDEQQIALAHSAADIRDALRIFFELDGRLARIVSATNEPMLGQMRLAWWREEMNKPAGERPKGDAVLDGIGLYWQGYEASLRHLVDGWEHMLSAELGDNDIAGFAKGRAAPFCALAEMAGEAGREQPFDEAIRWALADALVHIPDGDERDRMLHAAGKLTSTSKLSKALKGLRVLDALARRSIEREGRPLMEGRGASLVATRAAIFGR